MNSLKRFYKLKNRIKSELFWIIRPVHLVRGLIRFHNAPRRIFIDCGANTGAVFEKYIERNRGFEFHVFEPMPELIPLLEETISKYKDTPIHFYKKAVWIRNETLNFYLATHWGTHYKGASTLMEGHHNNPGRVDYENSIQVNAINFNEWIMDSLKPHKEDYIILKMDIEGAEYEVLERMIENETMDYISELLIEFHYKMNENITRERHSRLLKALRGHKGLKIIYWH